MESEDSRTGITWGGLNHSIKGQSDHRRISSGIIDMAQYFLPINLIVLDRIFYRFPLKSLPVYLLSTSSAMARAIIYDDSMFDTLFVFRGLVGEQAGCVGCLSKYRGHQLH